MGLKDVCGLEKTVGISKTPTVHVAQVSLRGQPQSWGRLVDVMFSVVRRCVIAKTAKTPRVEIGPRMFSIILLYQQAMRAIWETGGQMPQVVALCFDRARDKEMKLITALRREAQRADAAVVACTAAPAKCPHTKTESKWLSSEAVREEMKRLDESNEVAFADESEAPEKQECDGESVARHSNPFNMEVLLAASLAVEQDCDSVNAADDVDDTRSVVYKFLQTMFHHLSSLRDVPVPLLLSQGDNYVGPSHPSPSPFFSDTRGLIILPSMCEAGTEQQQLNNAGATAVGLRSPNATYLFVCVCRQTSTPNVHPTGLAVSATPFIQTLCDCLQRHLSHEKASINKIRKYLDMIVGDMCNDSWVCEHTRDSLRTIVESVVSACSSAQTLDAFRICATKHHPPGSVHAVTIAPGARVGEAEILVARIRTLLTGGGDVPTQRLGQTLTYALGPIFKPASLVNAGYTVLENPTLPMRLRQVYSIESIDSDSKILCCVDRQTAQNSDSRLVCSPKMVPGSEWWNSTTVISSVRKHVTSAIMLGLLQQKPCMHKNADKLLYKATTRTHALLVSPAFQRCVQESTSLWFAMPSLLGQDCVPDWLAMMGASYASVQQACARLVWGVASLSERSHEDWEDTTGLAHLQQQFSSSLGAGLVDVHGAVSVAAFAAVCALAVSVTPNLIIPTFDAMVGPLGNASAEKRKHKHKRKRSSSGSSSGSSTRDTPLPKRTARLGTIPLADCTHLLMRRPQSKLKRCEACDLAVVMPIRHKFGEALGAGVHGRMPNDLMEKMVRAACTPLKEGGARRGKYGNFTAGLSVQDKGSVLRQIVTCAVTLHRGYHGYVVRGVQETIHSTDGSLKYPETLIADDLDRSQLINMRNILVHIAKEEP